MLLRELPSVAKVEIFLLHNQLVRIATLRTSEAMERVLVGVVYGARVLVGTVERASNLLARCPSRFNVSTVVFQHRFNRRLRLVGHALLAVVLCHL